MEKFKTTVLMNLLLSLAVFCLLLGLEEPIGTRNSRNKYPGY